MIDDNNISQALTLKIFGLALLLCLLQANKTSAQFIDLRLDIDAEITAQTEQSLNFGTLSTNSGRRMIEFGSVNMGIFSITALENQLLLVTLDKPTLLNHDNPAIEETIPLELFARYGFSMQNHEDSFPLPEAVSNIKVEPNPGPGPWNAIYIFMYGTIDINDVPDGTYSNQIVLSVEYI
ncbi:hypothetical protein [Fodinibius sp. Rm-B-1B1-1]|uniref:hypothetical protein n=1 Tax=Fodinibius alkaliphilus TaxID=3140241 RepID=UPI00315AD0F2